MLRAGSRMLKKIVITFPAVYELPPFKELGQLEVLSTQREPYQKLKTKDMNKKRPESPKPRPVK